MLYEEIAAKLGESCIDDLQIVVERAFARTSGRRADESGREALEVLLTATLANVISRRPNASDVRRRAINCADMLEAGVLAALEGDGRLPSSEPTILAGTLH